jgi:outer membrane protein TolC
MQVNRLRVFSTAAALLAVTVLAGPLAAQEQAQVETFGLVRAVQVGLANSRVMANAEYQLQAANMQVKDAWGSAFPDIFASASYSRSVIKQEIFLPAEFFGGPPGETRPIPVGSDNNWNAHFEISQPLFEYGIVVGVGAANRFRELKEEELRGTAQQVVSVIRDAYFATLLSVEQLRLVEESLERVGATLEETRARHRAGLVSSYDVLRLEVEFASVEANLQLARNRVEARKRTLLVEMGLDPKLVIDIEGDLNAMDLEDPSANDIYNAELLRLAGPAEEEIQDEERLLELAYNQRTDLRQLRSAVSLEESRVSGEKSEFYPKLSFFSNYDIMAQQNDPVKFFGTGGQTRTSFANAGLQLEIPIFQGGSRFARVHEAEAMVRQQETLLERAEQEAINQIRTLVDGVSEARQRAASQKLAVQSAQRGFDIATAEYGEGIGSQLQVTDAEEALRQSQFAYAQAAFDYLSARSLLDLALGTVPEVDEILPENDS